MAEALGQADIAAMLEALARSHFRRLDLRAGGTRISTVRDRAEPEPATASAAAACLPGETMLVRAPRIGSFVAESGPAVAVGSRLDVGTAIGNIRTRRRTVPVLADRPGTIAALLASDGSFVEYGQPLLEVRPDGPGVGR